MAFLILGCQVVPALACIFPLAWVNAVGEATEQPFTNLVVVFMPIKSGLYSAYIDMAALWN